MSPLTKPCVVIIPNCFVITVVTCAILARTFGSQPPSVRIVSRNLEIVTVPSFCPSTFISIEMTFALFVIHKN